jgi:protein-tyrosine phosphatase
MDTQVHSWILNKWAGHKNLNKVHLFLKFTGNSHGTDFNVPDPYYGGVLEFRKVFGILEKECDRALDRIYGVVND